MQYDPKKRFSSLSTAVLWIVSVIVLGWLFFAIKDSMPQSALPLGETPASTTPGVSATSTPASSTVVASSTPGSAALVPALAYNLAVKAPGGTIHAAMAVTDAEREQGLSGQKALPKDSGVLFVFQSAGVYGFWMKDMNFPIDMVWIGADKTVSGVAPGVSPSSYPQIFYPPTPITYVLELASGEAAKMHIAPGSKLVF